MEASERDTTPEWLLPAGSRPPLVSELVERIEEAMAVARSSEAAAVSIGAAALDAADQARRAAELAEGASAAMGAERAPGAATAPAAPESGGLDGFAARADRLAARLRALERSAADPPASGDAAPRREAA